MRLLVVEDSKRLREAMSRGLRRAGYVVDAVADGEDGLARAQTDDYAAVILDLLLPKIDGLTLLRSLRARQSETRVLILSALDAVEERVRGLDAGADDYLVKPFAFDELLARIRNLCHRSYPAPRRRLVVADLEIDLEARVVRRAGLVIRLSPREFGMLEYLALHPGRVVTRAQIEMQVYDEEVEPRSNVVDATICRLRSKIDLPGRAPLIHTRRGTGYTLGFDA